MIRASTNSDEISSEIIIWARMPTSSSRSHHTAQLIAYRRMRIRVPVYPTGLAPKKLSPNIKSSWIMQPLTDTYTTTT